jgi:hypothetical protein
MGEKVYRPIVKDGNHLIRSKSNPDRVRGLTRDENNQNPGIPEWEEFDLDDLTNLNTGEISSSIEQEVELTPEEQQMLQEIGVKIGAFFIASGIILYYEHISPWWRKSALPWIKNKSQRITAFFRLRKKDSQSENESAVATVFQSEQSDELSEQIDAVFDQIWLDMDENEAKEHLMKLIYHMLGLANEIRLISNSQISKAGDSEEIQIERKKEVEIFLSQYVAGKLDEVLSNENLYLDLSTSRELFALTGGGVRLNGEYAPVQATKINEALKAAKIEIKRT